MLLTLSGLTNVILSLYVVALVNQRHVLEQENAKLSRIAIKEYTK